MNKKIIIIVATFLFIIGVLLGLYLGKKNNKSKEMTIDNIKIEFVNYLESKIQKDGSFEYIINLDSGAVLDDYSVLRHSLSYYALLKEYENNNPEEKKNTIKKGIDFLLPRIVEIDDKAFIISDNMTDFDLGNCSLVLILMSEYQRVYKTPDYQEYITKLADGIISMQRLEGRFNHLCTSEKIVLKEKDVIIYYEGEAALALLKAYKVTNDEKYLESAKKAIDYYVSNEYEKYADHWQEYAMLEFLKYNDESKYINYAIKNLSPKMDEIKTKKEIYNTDLETLKSGLEIYNKHSVLDSKYTIEEVKNEYENGLKLIEKDFDNLPINSLIESFFAKKGQNSIRIDDLAHYIMAF